MTGFGNLGGFAIGIGILLIITAVGWRIHRSERWSWRWLGGGAYYPWPEDVDARESLAYQIVASIVIFVLGAAVIVWLIRDGL